MTNVVITGTYPPDICGVGDQTFRLMRTETARDWNLFYKKKWNAFTLVPYMLELLSLRPGKIFLEYPSYGYGRSFVPHLLCFILSKFGKIRFIPVLHEYSELSGRAKLALNIILSSVKDIIVTNSFEKAALEEKNKKLNIHVIKIFSSVEAPKIKRNSFKERRFDLAYFGLIQPGKGIEHFIDAICTLRKTGNKLRYALIGATREYFKDYTDNLKTVCRKHDIEIIENRPLEEIPELLNDCRILFLPFPDGCSERRSSYLAGLRCGCVMVSTKGKYTTDAMLKTTFFVNNPNEYTIFNKLLDMTEWEYVSYQNDVDAFLNSEFEPSWEETVKKYDAI
jgi:glycosyltransferase involved in cell wall biosynthesis